MQFFCCWFFLNVLTIKLMDRHIVGKNTQNLKRYHKHDKCSKSSNWILCVSDWTVIFGTLCLRVYVKNILMYVILGDSFTFDMITSTPTPTTIMPSTTVTSTNMPTTDKESTGMSNTCQPRQSQHQAWQHQACQQRNVV